MIPRKSDGKIIVTSLVSQHIPPFDPDGSILARKAEEAGVSEAQARLDWEMKAMRGRQRGDTVTHYIKCKKDGMKYIGSHLAEFDALEAFFEEYELIGREEWVENDIVFGRLDIVVRKKDTGEEIVCEVKTGELGDVSYKTMNKPFDMVDTDKQTLARIQCALVTLLHPTINKGMVIHLSDTWKGIECDEKDFAIAEELMAYYKKSKLEVV